MRGAVLHRDDVDSRSSGTQLLYLFSETELTPFPPLFGVFQPRLAHPNLVNGELNGDLDRSFVPPIDNF